VKAVKGVVGTLCAAVFLYLAVKESINCVRSRVGLLDY